MNMPEIKVKMSAVQNTLMGYIDLHDEINGCSVELWK